MSFIVDFLCLSVNFFLSSLYMGELIAQQIRKVHGKEDIIGPLDMQFRPGTITGLIGQNGAGKSTALQLLMGEAVPDTGSIFYQQKNIWPNPRFYYQDLGFLPQKIPLFGELQVADYLLFCLNLRQTQGRHKEFKIRVMNLLKTLALDHLASKKIKKLSLGQKQRVGFAQAVIGQPKMLILDEPMSNLDPMGMKICSDYLLQIKSHTTIIISTHFLAEIKSLIDYWYMMDLGKIIFEGSSELIPDKPVTDWFEQTLLQHQYKNVVGTPPQRHRDHLHEN